MRHRWLGALAAVALAASLAAPARAVEDPWLWLEDVTAPKNLEWAAKQNEESKKELASTPEFAALESRFLEVLNSKARIPTITKIGDRYYNFWKDAEHERGIWRRATLEEYRKEQPAWELVLDLDALAKRENETWVWKSVTPLEPEGVRCLLGISRGGADAVVYREFDLAKKEFVTDGFSLPEAKSDVAWRGPDALWVGTDFGPGSLTTSGYPRVVKEWKRGTPLSAAVTVFEGDSADVSVEAAHDPTPGFERDYIVQYPTFFSSRFYLLRDGTPVRIEKPEDANAVLHREWLLIELRSDWSVGGKTWPAGALLATRLDDFLAGARTFEMLFTPSERKSLKDYTLLKSSILLNELENVRNHLVLARVRGGTWTRTPVQGLTDLETLDARAVHKYTSDDYFLTTTGFLTPTTLGIGTAGGPAPKTVKSMPAFFDARNLAVTQHEAVSKDGTRIPYFQVARRDLKLDGTSPTLLTGYGGFEVSELPSYSGTRGAGWLEKGGVLAVANLRGGGEFGPKWHDGGVKAQRIHCYQDMIAVGEDLVRRGVTRPPQLGCIGGSNGGLLVGNMLTMRPDLFGAVVCQVPLLDMRRYHKLLAGASWMGEYGNPDDPKEWSFIQEWSPYQNVKKEAKYPPMLVTTSTRDDRVHPGHARKMVAKMKEQGHFVRYYENIEGGHAGAANNRQQAYMAALAYTFLWKYLVPASAASRPVPQ